MAEVLVTGGAGFIGAHVAQHLSSMGHKVTVLDDLSGGFLENVSKAHHFVEGNIVDHELLARLFEEHKFEYVFHLAAYAAEGLSHFIRRFNYTNNLIGSVNLINESVKHNVRCFVFTSSIAVYGPAQVPMREDTTPIPEDPYGIAKLAVEQDLKTAHHMFGLNYVIFRPHNVYGEYQNIGDKYRNVVGIFMNRLLQGLDMPVFGDGGQSRAFTYVGDIAPLIARSIDVPAAYNEIFNVGADQVATVKEVAYAVADVMGMEPRLSYHEARKEVQHAYSDHEKVRRIFGDIPETSLPDGLRRMAEWVKEVGSRQSQDFKNIEIHQNLPSRWVTNK